MYNLDELLAELTAMNGNAKALLEKYENAGIKLDTKIEELLLVIVNARENALHDLQNFVNENINAGVIQVVYSELTTSGTGSGIMPHNSTEVPTTSHGNEILTISITPKRADSKLLVIANSFAGEVGNTADAVIGAIFRDDDTTCIVAKAGNGHSAGAYGALSMLPIDMQKRVNSNSKDETTFKLRVGVNAGACRWNGVGSLDICGDRGITTMTVMEIL